MLRDIQEVLDSICARVSKIGVLIHSGTEMMNHNEPIRLFIRQETVNLLSRVFSISGQESIRDGGDNLPIKDSIGQIKAGIAVLADISVFSRTTLKVLEDDFSALSAELEKLSPEPVSLQDSRTSSVLRAILPMGPYVSRSVNASSVNGNKSRREKIVELLRLNGPSSVSDLARTVEGCSDKTIQRELVSMVSLGLLKKTGDRRWSRYSLKAN